MKNTYAIQGNNKFPYNFVVKSFCQNKKSKVAFELKSIHDGMKNIQELVTKKEMTEQQAYQLMNQIYDLPLTIKIVSKRKTHMEKIAQTTRIHKKACVAMMKKMGTKVYKKMIARVKKKVGFQLN